MPFEMRSTGSGVLVTGSKEVTEEDGVAVLALLHEHPEWAHLLVDVSDSNSPFILTRDEELQGLHHLVRIIRDLALPDSFRIAIITSTVTAPRVADFLDLGQSLGLRIEIRSFTDLTEAAAWAGASISDD